MVTKENQIQFYSEELKELEFSVKKTFNATALSLFQNGDVYIGQYRGFDEKRGNVFVDIPTGKQYHAPRLDQKLTCFTLKAGLERPSSWSNLTYSDLLKDRNRTDTKIVDYIPSKREGWITMLIREMDSEFLKSLQYNQILAFGPTIPPFEYLQNLKDFSEHIKIDDNSLWNKILGFKYSLNKEIQPHLLTEDIDIAKAIIKEVEKSTIYLFQGPPGTGKTHQIADVVSRLVLQNYSVLITALTNKAAVEVCEKPFFNKLFEEDRISKLPISIDEKKRFPSLLNAKDLVPSKGHLTLTTFYQFSRIWEEQTQSFDYVIVEEASQAYLTTIAAACKVGKKVIIVGDPKQIVPIVTNKNYKVFPNIDTLINGMDTLSQIDDFSFNRKIETRRLSERSTEFTNSFYQNTIQSKSLYKDISEDVNKLNKLQHLTHSKGGPTLVLFSNKKANILARMLDFLVESIDELTDLKGNDIAVLTPYIETLTFLQQNLKSKTKSRNYLIESVDRVQGLDVDYCLYVIPRSSSFSFNINRFNVATSRAKKCTYILAEQDYDHFVNLPNEVGNYLSKLKTEFSFSINVNSGKDEARVLDIFNSNNKDDILKPKIKESVKNHIISKASSSGIGLKVTDKIDVSKFEKLKKEIKKNKENLYIIDTNVFVDFPEIITKIGKEYPVILSAKVIDELDNLKSTLNNDGKIKVQKALKSINRNIDKRDIRMEVADLSLLPIDFNKRSPDNLILTVALKFNTENPILLTSDNGLQVKAKGLKITTITLKEFLRR
jgi:rRNA-processing protein FCF1/Cdc6-like AAA superfamily ATPase